MLVMSGAQKTRKMWLNSSTQTKVQFCDLKPKCVKDEMDSQNQLSLSRVSRHDKENV